jgi:amino acid adenylation domain-containing protein
MDRLDSEAAALSLHRLINSTTVPYPDDCGIKELFEHCVERYPDRTAVVHRDREVTYRELNRLGNGIAAQLAAAGVRAGDTVGVCMDRSIELIAGLVAIIKCGGAYLPVDRSWPDDRVRAILAQAGARVVLGDRVAARASKLRDATVVAAEVAEAAGGADAASGAANPPNRTGPDDIAYINFTSGSTGSPKGVPIPHRAISRLVFGATYARLDDQTTTLQLATVSFDAATFEIWGSLLHGGTCVLYPGSFVRLSELGRVLRRHRVTVLFLTTALFDAVLDEAPQTLDAVPTILTGGEAHSIKHIDAALRRYGPGRVISVYGPTEATTFATYHPITEPPSTQIALPIGTPIQNTRLYVVADGALCGPGRVGEVWLAGPGLSPGYLGAPTASAERFIEYEVDGAVERLYRTGDLGVLREDGSVVFQGRLDDQVKINGFRIELGEVAHHIDQHPGVRRSFVTVASAGSAERRLVAFVVPGCAECGEPAIRAHLGSKLPTYMIPSRIHLCPEFPLSATGKVDGRALLSAYEPSAAVAP